MSSDPAPPPAGLINRRRWLHLAGWSGLATACGGGGGSGTPSPPPPPPISGNVLMIAVDDLNDWVGFLGGHPQVRTPALDALAARSTVFRRAYCTAPVCSPARAGVLSGLLPRRTGVVDNTATFSSVNPGKQTVDQQFASAGYTVERFGKIDHIWSVVPTPLPSPMPYTNKQCPAPVGENGFDWGPARGEDNNQPDYQYAQAGIDFLNQHSADQPFFLSVGFTRTHTGWYVPQRYFDLYPLSSIQLPYAPPDDLDDLGPEGRATALRFDMHNCIVRQGLWASAVRGYLASISWVDAQIGRLLAALAASPHADTTTVVFWSDHGFMLGEKFHWHKMALWEHATRVPFLIRRPGQTTGAVVNAPVSLADLAPTLLGLHGLTPAYSMDGQSLQPLLSNPAQAWDRPVLITRRQADALQSTGLDYAIRTAQWRYIRYANGEQELYDVVADPGELRNLAASPAHAAVIAQLDAQMPPTAWP
ncbi:sulfatase [Ideonella sp. 4Y16]|uniref:sulfatase n=1 Tax=Ideonella alba TaxID=2824118 RepID=UPI001B374FAE|nr:sulfatase [Ideonella alba]MBQ0943235.1 sulfatase [Ideonella alba]